MSFDTYISFRGEDTRNTFVGHLYKELVELGITTFMDNKKLLIGDSLNENLNRAIETSRSFIVVLSKNYASSKWCLRELVKIIDMTEQTDQVLLPVFYHVNPSDIRHQSRSFEKSFRKREQSLQARDKMGSEKYMEFPQWRRALTKVSSLSGVVVTEDSVEVDSIRKITKQLSFILSARLKLQHSYRFNMLVDIERRLCEMDMVIDLESNEVRFVGIIGMGGIGKTTIAKALYDKVAYKYGENRCFLHIYEHTLVSLQQQLLSQLLQTKDIMINDEDEGARMIGSYLKGKNVFIVLDGVNEKRELEKLVGSPDWFGAKSRLIITTRNRDVLRQPNYTYNMVEYNVKLLSNDDALELFCKHAFKRDAPDENFELLTEEIVEKVKGHPLALEIIGSRLYGRSEDEWKYVLKNDENLVNNILYNKILKTSYEGLDADSQEILLDLVCFFNGERLEVVKKILEAIYGATIHIKIQLLVDRFLIEIVNDKIHIDFLILSMRRRMVGCVMFPTRIWDRDDFLHVLQGETGFLNIHGIRLVDEEDEDLELDHEEDEDLELDHEEDEDLELDHEEDEDLELDYEDEDLEWVLKLYSYGFMKELKILDISNVKPYQHHIDNFLSNQLRVLKWPEFPLRRFPSYFHPRFMVQLILPQSKLQKLWEGRQDLEWLKEIDVSDSKHLIATPDLSGAPNLERLILRNCSRLSEIHPSITILSQLVYLDLGGCVNLRTLSSSDIICCSFPSQTSSNLSNSAQDENILMKYPKLNVLHVSPTIPQSGLTYLNLKNCTQFSSLPTSIGCLTSLITLNLNGCKNLFEIPPSLWTLNSLEQIDIGGTSIKQLLKTPPPVDFSMQKLQIINLEKLYGIESIWISFTAMITANSYGPQCIRDLNLSNCNLVDEDIPQDLRPINTLEILDLSGNHFVRLSESLSQLVKLKALYLNHCNKLKQLPTQLPKSLRYVGGIKSLPNKSEGSSSLPSPLHSKNPLVEEEYSTEADININKMEQPKSSNLVGMEDQLEKVHSLLDLENNEVIFLGIFGTSGIGKTSLARAVYETIAPKFESSCFLHISKQSNLPSLQHQLLSQLLLSKAPINVDEELIKSYLSGRKVVIVLDGVDQNNQIEKLNGLARSPDWFGAGSRIIITSNNRKVVCVPTFEDKMVEYNVALLDEASAFQLFCKHAFRNDHPLDQDFKDLSNNIIRKLERLPLALRGIGSFLYKKDIDIWKETSMKLSKVDEDFLSRISPEYIM